MTFNETAVNRDVKGQFSEKTGSLAEVSLVPKNWRPPHIADLREHTIVPLKNPFTVGDRVTIPAGATIYTTSSWGEFKGKEIASRKRSATAITAHEGYYYHVPSSLSYSSGDPDYERKRRILNDFKVSTPYVAWFGSNGINRVYLTPEFLEANGKTVEYDEEMFDKYANDIASGHFGVERITKS